jgi:hypothetical protein
MVCRTSRHIETFCENSQVQVLPRQGLATGRDRVLRGFQSDLGCEAYTEGLQAA